MTSSGIFASRSMTAPLTEVSQNSRSRFGVRRRLRVDQAELEVAEEELLAEAGLQPGRFPGRLGDLPGLLLVDVLGGVLAHAGRPSSSWAAH
jgi:hypothetical protein